MRCGIVDRADLQLDARGVVEWLGQRNVGPAEARLAHVDGDAIDAGNSRGQDAGCGFEHRRWLVGLGRHKPGDAAHAVAAGPRQRAIRIVDAHEGVGSSRHRLVQHHHLLEAGAGSPGDGAGLGFGEDVLRGAQIHDDDLVAKAVHLAKGNAGSVAHAPLYGAPGADDNSLASSRFWDSGHARARV